MTRPPAVPPPRGSSRARPGPGQRSGSRPSVRPSRAPTPPLPKVPEGGRAWLTGVGAAAQGALLSMLVVVAPAVTAFVATSGDPVNVDMGWPQAALVGMVLWLLGHGGAVAAGGTTVTLVPLGLTILAVFTAYASARRSMVPTRSAWVAGAVTYTAVVVATTTVVGALGPWGVGPGAVARTVLGGALVALVGLGAGAVQAGQVREVTRRWWEPVPSWVRTAGTAGVMLTATLVAAAGALTAVWVLAGRAPAGDVITALGLDGLSGGILAVGQVVLLPNLVVWAVAWLAGPGFAVGSGTLYSPAEVVTGPLPAIPLLAALPEQVPGVVAWTPLVVVGAGLLAGRWLSVRVEATRPWHTAAGCATAALVAGVVTAAVVACAGGAAGPGRLVEVGAPAGHTGLVVAGLGVVGLAVVALPADRALRAWVVRAVSRDRDG